MEGNMLQAIRELITPGNGKGTTSAARVQEAIDTAEAELSAARARVRRLEEEHADILLEQTDDEAARHEEEIAAAEREVRRLETAIPRLQARKEEAEAAETRKASAAALEATREAAAAVEDGIERYEKLAEDLATVLKEIEAAEGARLEAQGRVTEADHAAQLPEVRLVPPRWEDGGSIIGTRRYGGSPTTMGGSKGHNDHTVQLPSTRRPEPFWGSTPALSRLPDQVVEARHDVEREAGTYSKSGGKKSRHGARDGARVIAPGLDAN